MIKLETGRKYKTREGLDVECLGINPWPHSTNDNWAVVVNDKFPRLVWYFENGNWMAEHQEEEYPMDIVAEVN